MQQIESMLKNIEDTICWLEDADYVEYSKQFVIVIFVR